MAKAIITRDPYRDTDTTLAAFAKAEGVPKHTVSHYYWYHKGTLEGFRDRPKEGYGPGLKPQTYTWKGRTVTLEEAAKLSGLSASTISRYHKYSHMTAADQILESAKAKRQKRLERRRICRLSDGRIVTSREFAKAHGVTLQAVYSYRSKHGGSLDGFATRGRSRVNPSISCSE